MGGDDECVRVTTQGLSGGSVTSVGVPGGGRAGGPHLPGDGGCDGDGCNDPVVPIPGPVPSSAVATVSYEMARWQVVSLCTACGGGSI